MCLVRYLGSAYSTEGITVDIYQERSRQLITVIVTKDHDRRTVYSGKSLNKATREAWAGEPLYDVREVLEAATATARGEL